MTTDPEPDHFSDDFLRAVGAVVVAGGQVERALQNLLLSLQRQPIQSASWAVRRLGWGKLLEKVRPLAERLKSPPDADAPLTDAQLAERAQYAQDLAAALTGAEDLAEVRNDVVHAMWATDGEGKRNASRTGGSHQYWRMMPAEEMEAHAVHIQDLARRIMAVTRDPGFRDARLPLASVQRMHEPTA